MEKKLSDIQKDYEAMKGENAGLEDNIKKLKAAK